MTYSHRILLAACCLFLGLAACSGNDTKSDGGPAASDGSTTGDEDGGVDPACASKPCGDHATCTVDDQNQVVCGCVDTYVRIDGACELGRCAVENGGCDAVNGICTASVDNKNRTCACKVGYLGDGVMCVKDPCYENATCGEHSTCERRNNNMDYVCTCDQGYVADGATCIEDRCLVACGPHATCSNNPAQAKCTCEPNYHMVGDNCVANTPCDSPATFSCKANSTCANQTDGTYECVCNIGYEGNGKVACTEYHPCENTVCYAHSTCHERNYQAYCDCDSGWEQNAAKDACEDTNECTSTTMPASCGAAFDCVNKPGSYDCVCKDGTVGDPVNGCRAGYLQPQSAGKEHVCAVATDHTLWCWGRNQYGQLAQPLTMSNSAVPTQVGTATDWLSVQSGANHACAIKTNGSLWCWGNNAYGQVGNGSAGVPGGPATPPVTTPTRVSGNWGDVSAVGAGADFTCAIRHDSTSSNNTLWCWGNNTTQQLGRPSTTSGTGAFFLPDQVGTDTDWSSVQGGNGHGCGLKSTGSAYCWGDNTYGQLGNGTYTNASAPTLVADPTGAGMSVAWSLLSTYGVFTCGIAGGEVYCWGDNNYGQLGNIVATKVNIPGKVGAQTNWTSLTTGARHACAVRGGELWCWGYDILGQAGKCPAMPQVLPPQQVGTSTDWQYVDGGESTTCGNRTGATLWCWGDNYYGQLGNGTTSDACLPVQSR